MAVEAYSTPQDLSMEGGGNQGIGINIDYGNLQFMSSEYSSHSAVSAYFQNQGIGIDSLLNAQSEKLSRALQEQRWQQIQSLLQKHEPRIRFLIKSKEEEIARAWRRKMELEEIARSIEIEKENWQRIAKENEATMASLLDEQMKLEEGSGGTGPGDAESLFLCERDEDLGVDVQKTRICRICQSRKSCVIMLPCRHLCCCTHCEPFLQFCPVCNLVKEASFEAFFV